MQQTGMRSENKIESEISYDCATDETKLCNYNPVPVDGEYSPEKYKFNESILLLLSRAI